MPPAAASSRREKPSATKARDISFQIGTGVKTREVVIFTRQLATMINSGLPLVQSLTILSEQTENKAFKKIIAQVLLDIQAGRSTLQQELPTLIPYLERPDVHLGVDPEFYMHYKREGLRPGVKVGQMMSGDVNGVIQTLDKLARDKNLPPKVLVVHRFRADMLPDAENIKPTPRVQVVMHMDGWGPPWMKFESFRDYIDLEPVEYTGFKLFFHNDTKRKDALLTPGELLWLRPRLLYVQYQ